MPEKRRRRIKRVLVITGIFFLLITALIIYMLSVALIKPPAVADKSALNLKRHQVGSGMYTIGNSWFRKSKSGLYEMYVEGKPFERGVITGKLSEELVMRQEDHFNEQI